MKRRCWWIHSVPTILPMTYKIAVTSPSFCQNIDLVEELKTTFPELRLNTSGKKFNRDELTQFLADVDGAVIGLDIIDAELLGNLPNLKIISKYGVGLDGIDQEALKRQGISLGWTPGVNRKAVAEQTIGCMIGLARNLFGSIRAMGNGKWIKDGGFQLSDAKVGIIGLGHVGQQVVEMLQPFGCKILANDIENRAEFARRWDVLLASKEQIFQDCDLISLHVPLTPLTAGMIDLNFLKAARKSCFLINTSRGGVINESDLFIALSENLISGAYSDVFEVEPCLDSPLLKVDTFFATPHIGGNSKEAVLAMGRSAIEHLRKYFYE